MKLHLPVLLRKALLACISFSFACSEVSSAADLTLGGDASLTIDYADANSIPDLAGDTLQLSGDAILLLSNCGVGDGKTYTLLTGFSGLVDADGNAITLDSTNNAISNYFDYTRPGSGFWAGGILQVDDGRLQVVLHAEAVKDALTITTRQTGSNTYNYYEDIRFRDITYSSSALGGGAIYESGDITLCHNGSVVFEGNKASAPTTVYDAGNGGAIHGGDITLSNNGNVIFSMNTTYGNGATGGAIYGNNITLSGNSSVEFTQNRAWSKGGAIDGENITLSDNYCVEFTGNKSERLSGGAIYGKVSALRNDSVVFSGNRAWVDGGAIYGASITLSQNGRVDFSGNWSDGDGGAICCWSFISISGNGYVIFRGNTASYGGSGGAIYGEYITLSDNGSMMFSENKTTDCGGAIYTRTRLSIRNNESVGFYQNFEVADGAYRLRSIYAVSSGIEISLSAAAGKNITFRDSIYIGSGSSFKLNEAYGGMAQQGDIIFTGATTENDLYTVKGNVAGTAEEIRLSRTTEVYTLTEVYGGRLRVEDGAIYQGRGITAHAGSAATVLVKDATLSHAGYDLTFNAGTTLELAGNNTISGNVQMLEGSSLVFDLTQYQGITTHSGSWNVADATSVCVDFDSSEWTGEWGEIKTIALLKTDADLAANLFDLSISPLTGNWGHSGLQWEDGTLSIAFKNGATDAVWTNAADDFCWNNESYNWTDFAFTFARVDGADVTFGKSAEGSILLDGQMTVGKMTVSADAGYTLDFAEGASLIVQKELVLERGTSLTVHGNLDAAAVNAQGVLVVDGSLNVDGKVLAASLQTRSLVASSLELTDSTASNHIGSAVEIVGSAEIGGSLIVEGSLSAASLQAAALEATSLKLTDANASNHIGGAVEMVGSAEVAGSLMIDGTLTASSLQAGALESTGLKLTDSSTSSHVTGSVQVSGVVQTAANLTVGGDMSAQQVSVDGTLTAGSLTLTGSGAGNVVTGTLNVERAVQSSASLSLGGAMSAQQVSVAGALTAASLQTDALETASLNLTDGGASNRIGSSVAMTGGVESAGSLTVEGTLTAASLKSASLEVAGLTLTDSSTASQVTGAVQVSGQVQTSANLTVGGAMSAQQVSVAGALTAGSLQTEALETDSLTLTDGGACNRIGSSVAMTGGVESAGSLTVEGTLTAASLKSASLEVAGLTLTDSSTASQVTGAVQVSGQVQTSANLTVGGAMSAQQVSVAGALTAGSLQTEALETDSLTLTDGGASNRIGSSVAMAGAVDGAGSLSVAGSLTAASLQAKSLDAASLTLTDTNAQNHIVGDATLAGAVNVAGALSVEGMLTAASVQSGTLDAGSLVLAAANTANTVSGNLTVDSVSLLSGSSLAVGGVLTAAEVLMKGTAQNGVSADSFGSETMNFVLDRAALESLNIAQGERSSIASTDMALSPGFKALLNGSVTESVNAAAYTYTIATSGNMVQVEADYRWWDTQVWYRGAWVGESDWDEYLVAGYDAVDGKETIDLGGGAFSGFTLMLELEDGVDSVTVSNGILDFEYIDMFAGHLDVGDNTTVNVTELYAEGLSLGISGTGTSVTVSGYLNVGEVSLDYAKLNLAEAEIGAMSGTTGALTIADGGDVSIGSDVTLSSLVNGGSLDMSGHKLVVNGLTDQGGDVIAGEVSTRSNMRKAATFDCLIADKVTVTNSNGNSRYTDDISVGGGSAIGELVAETLELRDGSMQLGRDDKATSQSLQKLKLAAGTGMELNENTALAVTGTLDAGANTTVSMKQGASLSYGDVRISNKRSDATASVTARELADGTGAGVTNAHASFAATAEKSVDYQFVNSSVENVGSKQLTLTNSGSTLTGLHATGGNVDVQALGDITLAELEIAAAKTISAASVTVTELVKLADGAKLAGNLTLARGATVELGGTLTLEGALNLQTGLTLSGTVLETISGLEEGQSHILFSGVSALNVQETMTLSNMRSIAAQTQQTASYRELMDGQQVEAGDYFSNLAGNSGLVLSYNSEAGTVSVSHTQAIPEPTTATLSLLALAGLCARRRRK